MSFNFLRGYRPKEVKYVQNCIYQFYAVAQKMTNNF